MNSDALTMETTLKKVAFHCLQHFSEKSPLFVSCYLVLSFLKKTAFAIKRCRKYIYALNCAFFPLTQTFSGGNPFDLSGSSLRSKSSMKYLFTVLCGPIKGFFQVLIFPKDVHPDKYFPYIYNTVTFMHCIYTCKKKKMFC